MSSGHHTRQSHGVHHPDDIAEYERLCDDPRIRNYLHRHYRVDTSHKIPLTGGSSLDGRIYYLDKDLPQKFRLTVLRHERIEKALRAVFGMSYSRAHRLATIAERLLVEKSHMDWNAYKKEIASFVRRDETPAKPPPDLDPGPYKESGTMNLLAG